MNDRLRQEYLSAIGIQGWQLKESESSDSIVSQDMDSYESVISDAQGLTDLSCHNKPPSETISTQAKTTSAVPVDTSSEQASLVSTEPVQPTTINSQLSQTILNCKKCSARTGRYNALVGQGNDSARVFIISDAPNVEEDRAGHYLTGQANSLFQAMCQSIDLVNDYFFTGIAKCYSLENFLVNESEWTNCAQFLYGQLEAVNPDVVVVFGSAQAQRILQTEQSFNDLRGMVHKTNLNGKEYSLVVTFHPAYLLRNPLFKKSALADLLTIKSLLK